MRRELYIYSTLWVPYVKANKAVVYKASHCLLSVTKEDFASKAETIEIWKFNVMQCMYVCIMNTKHM